MLVQNKGPIVNSKYIPEPDRLIKSLEIGEHCFVSDMLIWLDEDNKLWINPNFRIQESGYKLKLTKKAEGYSLFISKNYDDKFSRTKFGSEGHEPIIEIEYEQNDE